MKRIVIGFASIVFALSAGAQTVSERKNIEKLCGCFEVEFKYAETFSPDTAYKYHDREEISAGLELALPIEISDKRIVIQHLLVIDNNNIIKHWREDWVFEPNQVWKYQGDKVWSRQTLSPDQSRGRWMQTVWEVSDAPRYQGASEWVNTDGKTFWQNTTDAPLPRREYSVRNDYNILRRTNRIVLNDNGYVHEQDNKKIIRKNGTDKLLVEEKGLNTYVRVADSKCDAAKAYWQKNSEYWSKVRLAWESFLASHQSITLKDKVGNKVLHQYLGELGREYAEKKIKAADIDASIRAVLEKYLDTKDVANAGN